MNSFAKVAAVAGLVFACMSVVSYANVNKFDLGEVTQDGLKTIIALGLGYIALYLKPSQVLGAAVLIAVTVLAGAGEAQAGPFGLFTRGQSSSCPNGQCSQPAVSQPVTTTTKEAKTAVAAPAGGNPLPAPQAVPEAKALATIRGPLVATTAAAEENRLLLRERERKIGLLSREGRALFRRLQSDAAFRERVAAEWNKTYAEKISPDDLDNWLAVIVKWLPYLLEIIFKLV